MREVRFWRCNLAGRGGRGDIGCSVEWHGRKDLRETATRKSQSTSKADGGPVTGRHVPGADRVVEACGRPASCHGASNNQDGMGCGDCALEPHRAVNGGREQLCARQGARGKVTAPLKQLNVA